MPGRIGITARRVGTASPSARTNRDLPTRAPARPCPARTPRSRSVHGVVGQRQGDRVEPAALQVRQRVVPVGQAGPREGEDRPHRHLDRAAVQRVGAPRRQQHGVDPERGGGAEDRARRWCGRRCPRRPRRCARPSSTSSTEGSGVRASDARAPRCTWKPVTCSARASLTTKHGASVPSRTSASPSSQRGAIRKDRTGKPASDGPAYDLLALGEEQAVLGLERLAQLDVAQVAVVGEAGVAPGRRSRRTSPCDAQRVRGSGSGGARSAPGAPPPPPRRRR